MATIFAQFFLNRLKYLSFPVWKEKSSV